VELYRYTKELDGFERDRLGEGDVRLTDLEERVERAGVPIHISALDSPMQHFRGLVDDKHWSSPELSDAWLAPRIHATLRLTRAEAGDKGMWHWLALRFPDYVTYRWEGSAGVAHDRWFGPVHKQALARLWWGAELFRDGPDYGPVDFFFARQDFPNSYLHRSLVRCRPLALGMIDKLREVSRTAAPKASHINDLARVLNLTTAGIPPEVETGFYRDDAEAYEDWIATPAQSEVWDVPPAGPRTGTLPTAVKKAAFDIATRGWDLAPGVAKTLGSRGASAKE
jgi:hypothetical protein